MNQNVTSKDISQARNPDLRAAMAALKRASESAREIAIQTNTAIVVVEDGKRMRITAEQLRDQQGKQLGTT